MFLELRFSQSKIWCQVVAWGSRDFGGDAAAVQGMLYNVQMIQSSRNAFAALRDWVNFQGWEHC